WIFDSLMRRRFREAALRAALVAVPIIGWQGYIATVERSPSYRAPAYEYQRAPYLFYNVSYSENMRLRDPSAPEKGQVRIVRRVARNMTDLPARLGEVVLLPRGYAEMALHRVFGDGRILRPVIVGSLFTALSLAGLVFVGGGLVCLLRTNSI